ncbi:hypothetical protein JCM33374_g4053 [Metschnikowia sp. JCM 33374]|nr:hypothetical protein JCM33374_g4053 [Metschnikowia sp. JCM 33374]
MSSRQLNTFLDSEKYDRVLSGSPVHDEEDEFRPMMPNPGRGSDFSFLSANFSSDSLHNDVDNTPSTPRASMYIPSAASANTTLNSASNTTPAQPLSYASKRYSFNGSNSSLANSPAAPVGQPSFSHHQRTGSTSRPRPRSFFGTDSSNYPIWEYATDATFQEFNAMNATSDPDKSSKRNSGHFSSRRASFTPTANFQPPSEPRIARSPVGTPSRGNSPVRHSNTSPYRQRASSPSKMQPFNFKPQDLSVPSISGGSPSLVAKPAHRKGHRYKHSSVSMNLFQEPLPIADANQQPNLIPDSYPIPNLQESFGSANKSQKFKLTMSLVHSLTALVVFVTGVRTQQHAFSTLAHLIFYDSLGSLMASCVDIMSNFEVWGKSSIAYPFGLGRLEVLTSFALSTSSVMVGCDLISHFVEELVVELVDPSISETTDHGAHHIHGSKHKSALGWILYEMILLLAMAVTWITSTYIFDQAPLLQLMANKDSKPSGAKENGLLDAKEPSSKKDVLASRIKSMSNILVNNPIRLLTLLYSAFLSVAPIIPDNLKDQFGFDLNESSTLIVALLLCYAGWNLVKTLGGILLISFPYSDYDFTVTKSSIHDRIVNLASFKAAYSLEKLHVTKANPSLYLAGVQVRMKGASSDDESRLIFEINRIIVETMKNFENGCSVETTISADRV